MDKSMNYIMRKIGAKPYFDLDGISLIYDPPLGKDPPWRKDLADKLESLFFSQKFTINPKNWRFNMFTKAQRKESKLRLAITGTSGSGKTYSSLQIAKGLGGPIAMIDTEMGSSELYSDLADFDVARLTPPFPPSKYIKAIKMAESMGYNVLIIDSLSHAWVGEGGILEEVDKRKSTQKNQFAAWREMTPQHNSLVNAILQSNFHVIVTMRSKTAYDMQKDEKGRLRPVKIGLAPVQRDGLEYEFTTVLEIDADKHIAHSSKDRTGLFDGQYFVPSIDTGKDLKNWLEQGKDEISAKQTKEIEELSSQLGLNPEQTVTRINQWLSKKRPTRQISRVAELTSSEASLLIEDMTKSIETHNTAKAA